MSNFLVQGKLGTGKGKYTVGKMQHALRFQRRVATNCDLFMEHLMSPNNRMTATRVPDKPTPADLDAIGFGCADEDRYDEDKYGVMVLDELGAWLNARSHTSPDRQAFIEWMIHARKKRWHVYFICQDIGMVDRQVRDGLVEYLVKLIRGDKVRIPVVGKILGKLGKLKGLHIANLSMVDMPGFILEREWFRGSDLHKAYDTLQIFRSWHRDPKDEEFKREIYAGPYSYLSAWHLKGRYLPVEQPKTVLQRLFKLPDRTRPPLRPKLPAIDLAASLSQSEAWQLARRYAMQLDRVAA